MKKKIVLICRYFVVLTGYSCFTYDGLYGVEEFIAEKGKNNRTCKICPALSKVTLFSLKRKNKIVYVKNVQDQKKKAKVGEK